MTVELNDTVNIASPATTRDIRSSSKLMLPIEVTAAALLVSIVVLLLSGVVSRYCFSHPLAWVDEASSIAFLWLAMLGAVIAIDRAEHLRLTLFLDVLSARRRRFAHTLGLVLMAAFILYILPSAYEYMIEEMDITSSALNMPAG